ncbi:MAG: DUF4239 domain-containing protein [Candidatus Omnitrophica bacterium]|nr:DUF4239 domain-containing protein [Candidatus Omnitrophota bacterium]
MPITQKILFYIPIIPLGMIMVFLAVALSIVGLWLVWKFVPRNILKSHNDLTNAIFQAIALAYTVLLAFVVVVAWQNYDKAVSHTETEANCLVDIFRSSAAFGKTFETEARAVIKEYGKTVILEEWESLSRGEENAKAREALRKMWELYVKYEPKSEKENIFYAESIDKLDGLREMRRLRIIDSRTGVHPVLWFVLLVGALTTISFTFFFGSDKFINHAIMASALGVTIALILLTILSFGFPFTGSGRIEPKMFMQVLGVN